MDEVLLIQIFARKDVIEVLRYLRDAEAIHESHGERTVDFPREKFAYSAVKILKDMGLIVKLARSHRCTIRTVGLAALEVFDSWTRDDFRLLNVQIVQLFCWGILRNVNPNLLYKFIGKDPKGRVEQLFSPQDNTLTPLGENCIKKMQKISQFLANNLPDVISERPRRFPAFNRHETLLKYLQLLTRQIETKIKGGQEIDTEQEGTYDKHCAILLLPKEYFDKYMKFFAIERLVHLNVENPRKKYLTVRSDLLKI